MSLVEPNKNYQWKNSFYKIEAEVSKRILSIVNWEKNKVILKQKRKEVYNKTKKQKGIKNHDEYWILKRKELMGIKT